MFNIYGNKKFVTSIINEEFQIYERYDMLGFEIYHIDITMQAQRLWQQNEYTFTNFINFINHITNQKNDLRTLYNIYENFLKLINKQYEDIKYEFPEYKESKKQLIIKKILYFSDLLQRNYPNNNIYKKSIEILKEKLNETSTCCIWSNYDETERQNIKIEFFNRIFEPLKYKEKIQKQKLKKIINKKPICKRFKECFSTLT